MNFINQIVDRARDVQASAMPVARRTVDRLVYEARRLVDRDKWATATTLRERMAAVSWPRASIVGAGLTVAVVGVWFIVQPHGVRAYAPPLPTEQQMQARIDAARALEADLSPALARANETVREPAQ